jgi:hypothetical protein
MSTSIQNTILFIPKQKLDTYKRFPKRKREKLIEKNSVKLTIDELESLDSGYFNTIFTCLSYEKYKYIPIPRFFNAFLFIVDNEINRINSSIHINNKKDVEEQFSYFDYSPSLGRHIDWYGDDRHDYTWDKFDGEYEKEPINHFRPSKYWPIYDGGPLFQYEDDEHQPVP